MRIRLIISALAAGAIGLLVATLANATGNGASGKGEQFPVGQHFSIFERPLTGADSLPDQFVKATGEAEVAMNRPDSRRLALGQARLAYSDARARYFVIPQGEDSLCLLRLASGAEAGMEMGCTNAASASNPDTPAIVEGAVVYGLVPDDVRSVSVTTTNGANRPATVVNNMFVAPPDADAAVVTIERADGQKYSHRIEKLPMPDPPTNG